VATIGDALSRAFLACGRAVFSWKEYESRIRGGHNRYSIRVGEKPANAPLEQADALLCLNKDAYSKYRPLLKDGGVALGAAPEGAEDKTLLNLDFRGLAQERHGNKIYANTVAAGAVFAVLHADPAPLLEVLRHRFGAKGEKVVKANIEAAKTGFDEAKGLCGDKCGFRLEKGSEKFVLASGNEAVALGSARAGCRFISAYPMTPSTGIITFFHKNADKLKVFTEQAEDEIAAVNMAIGASFAGARAMTASSGGGFALMMEGISLAGMTETPLVIVLAQRPGPATGLPTRTSQGDLLFAVNAGHGEFPKAVIAVTDPKDAYHQVVRAHNLADKYQTVVILLTDQFLADADFSYTDMGFAGSTGRFYMAAPEAFEEYKRYKFTEEGISPRLYPGQSRHLVCADSDEHDELGHITEDLPGTAMPMVGKRLRKIRGLQKEMEPPEHEKVDDAETVFIGWGSTRGALAEAVAMLRDRGKKVGRIHFKDLWPLPTYRFPRGKKFITVENNATSQLARLLPQEYQVAFSGHINRFDGLPLSAAFVAHAFEKEHA